MSQSKLNGKPLAPLPQPRAHKKRKTNAGRTQFPLVAAPVSPLPAPAAAVSSGADAAVSDQKDVDLEEPVVYADDFEAAGLMESVVDALDSGANVLALFGKAARVQTKTESSAPVKEPPYGKGNRVLFKESRNILLNRSCPARIGLTFDESIQFLVANKHALSNLFNLFQVALLSTHKDFTPRFRCVVLWVV